MHLPPGQRRVESWPVLDLGVQREVPTERRRLVIDGLVDNPIEWDWATFRAAPQFRDVSDIHCVTQWSRFDNTWEGVSAKHILALVRPKQAARFVVFHGHDDYTTNLPLEYFDDGDVLLTHFLARASAPARAWRAGARDRAQLYFWKSAKWIRGIEFLAEDRSGFWEERSYHDRGDPWKEERDGYACVCACWTTRFRAPRHSGGRRSWARRDIR